MMESGGRLRLGLFQPPSLSLAHLAWEGALFRTSNRFRSIPNEISVRLSHETYPERYREICENAIKNAYKDFGPISFQSSPGWLD